MEDGGPHIFTEAQPVSQIQNQDGCKECIENIQTSSIKEAIMSSPVNTWYHKKHYSGVQVNLMLPM